MQIAIIAFNADHGYVVQAIGFWLQITMCAICIGRGYVTQATCTQICKSQTKATGVDHGYVKQTTNGQQCKMQSQLLASTRAM